jgi:multidrug efflux pump
MRCAQFLEVGERQGRLGKAVDNLFHRLEKRYEKALGPALHHRAAVLMGATVFFVLSLLILPLLQKELMPRVDSGRFMARFYMPVGTSIDATDRAFRQAESILESHKELERYFGFIGGFGGGAVNSGLAFLTMHEPRDRPVDPVLGHRMNQEEFMNRLRGEWDQIPGLRAVMQDPSQSGFSSGRGFPVEIAVQGPDWETLAVKSKAVMARMQETGLVTDLDSNYEVGMPEVEVIPDRNKAADLGISMADIGGTVNAAIGGERVGKFKDKGRRYDIRVRLLSEERRRPADIGRLLVRSSKGGLVRLADVVKIEQRPSLQSITRRDRQRAITITANVAPGASQAEAIEKSLAIAGEVLPDGYRAVPTGTSQAMNESFESLVFAFIMGLIVAYMVLATQFNAFTHPFTVLLALPFSVSGALAMLWIAGQTLNLYSFLGLILLMGIAKKNSIMLVDFTNQARERGMDRHAALLWACPVRLRPILMTSVATISGALPPALAIGPGAELQRPMALTVVGGMIVSTFLTLFVVPAAYSLIADAVAWNESRRDHGVGLLEGLHHLRSGSGKAA